MSKWIRTTIVQPPYDETVLLSVQRGRSALVVLGYRDRTERTGDTYIVTNWRDGQTARVPPADGPHAVTSNDEWIVTAWQFRPSAYTPDQEST